MTNDAGIEQEYHREQNNKTTNISFKSLCIGIAPDSYGIVPFDNKSSWTSFLFFRKQPYTHNHVLVKGVRGPV